MVKISDDTLISELRRCYENEGVVDGPTLNDTSNDYPTQPTYSYRFDGGLREACEIADVPYGKNNSWDERSIINAAEQYFEENGTLFVSDFDKSDTLPSTSILYNNFDSIKDLVEQTSLTEEIQTQKQDHRKIANQKQAAASRKYNPSDKDALENHLWWVLKEYGDTKTDTINDAPGPSSNIYTRIYGSIVDARREAGIDSVSYKENFRDRIGDLPESYDENANGYIYVLKMIKGGEEYYYVGMSTRLKKRLNTHSLGKSMIMLHHENRYDTMKDMNMYPVCVVRIDNHYINEDESEDEFRDRLKSAEHIVSHQVSAAFNTDKILGGRS